MNRLRFALLLSSAIAVTGIGSIACGGISDPTRGSSERVATVSGALTGAAVPANARVALVWRKAGGGVEVGDDVAIVGGKFTMSLGVPAARFFDKISGEIESSSPQIGSGGSVPPTDPSPPPPSSGSGGTSSSGGGGKGMRLTPRDFVSGQITEPLTAAIGGFVVYADTNGNGKLDLEGQYASSPDQILGGNKELILVYLKDGGALDYEKLRDKSGILPASGFNLAWREGRWLPLNVVELELGKNALPHAVCTAPYGAGGYSSGSVGEDVPNTTLPPSQVPAGSSGTSGGTDGSYPSAGNPNLHCAPDGRSFQYYQPVNCPPYTPPTGLCADDLYETAPCAGSGGWGGTLPSGTPAPAGWPCTEPTVSVDAGPAPLDAGTD